MTRSSTNASATPTAPTAEDLARTYQPKQVEPGVLEKWNAANAFHAVPDPDREPYVIVIPPPNVTAALHMGHALNNTLQDILIRWRRMQGYNTVWMPGTDHAGIATQTVVEKRVQAEEGKRRIDFTREQFVEKVQAWKDEYERRITEQLVAMGCSCDWPRQRFTMDPICAAAVREAFFRLFADGLIYRGKRLVNWDPVTQTALADDEVESFEIDGHFWYMQYPILNEDGGDSGEFVTVATTRPETMLGDTAVAINPRDPRAASLLGRHVRLPIVNRVIPIVADEYVIMPEGDADAGEGDEADDKASFATGFLKVTPAHDPNDWEIGLRQNPPLPVINVLGPDGRISRGHGWPSEEFDSGRVDPFVEELLGKDRFEARKLIVDWFDKQGLLPQVRPYRHSVGHSYRSHVPIEPYLSDQWYVRVTDDRLAGAALRVLNPGQRGPTEGCTWKEGDPFADEGGQPTLNHLERGWLTFYPPRYARTYQQWHEHIRDWCISRQLWWGHRIPVWSRHYESRAEFTGSGIGSEEAAMQDELSDRLWSLEETHGQVCSRFVADGDPGRFLNAAPHEGGFTVYVCVRDESNEASDVYEHDIIQLLETCGFEQDPDVLDTWFSSALWPISTLGWPDPEGFPEAFPEGKLTLEKWNPGNTLCTAREIITLWVSRMVMFNLYLRNCLPFYDVFIHAMIQDGEGQKMSKSLGNGVDPLDIIHSHGADAMRFTLAQMTTHTQDVRMPVDLICPYTEKIFTPETIAIRNNFKVAAPVQESPFAKGKKMVSGYGYASGEAVPSEAMPLARNTSSKFDYGRNFANKLWNAVRFALGRLEAAGATGPLADAGELGVADHWILSRLVETIGRVDTALEQYEFNVYAQMLYDFTWGDLCDWYIEAIKPTVEQNAAQRAVLAACLDATLRLLHPGMPFVTERLWERLNAVVPHRGVPGMAPAGSDLLVCAAWPDPDPGMRDGEAEEQFGFVQSLVSAVRQVRTQYKVPPRQKLTCSGRAPAAMAQRTLVLRPLIETLANVELGDVGPKSDRPADAAATTAGRIELYLHGLIDPEQERQRLEKRLKELENSIGRLESRLNNKGYVDRAPAELVQQTRQQLADLQKEARTVKEQRDALG